MNVRNQVKMNDRHFHVRCLEIELKRELNQPRVVACLGDAAEISRVEDLTSARVNARGVEIAVRVGEVDLVEKIEELGAELDTLRFAKREALDDGEVDVNLSGAA